jgi:hypothetical protein
MAHHLAAWLGIPAGIVIAAMVIMRKKGTQLRARRQQARDASPTLLTGHVPATSAQANLGRQVHWPLFFGQVTSG